MKKKEDESTRTAEYTSENPRTPEYTRERVLGKIRNTDLLEERGFMEKIGTPIFWKRGGYWKNLKHQSFGGERVLAIF